MPPELLEGLDGRTSRTVRSRAAICEACLDLVLDGELQPSAAQIADRAGMSRRSVFNHFSDLAELYDAVAEAGMQRCAPLLEEIPQAIPVHQRVERLVDVRSRFLEATAPFTRALTAQALTGTTAKQALRVSRDALRIQHQDVARIFERELAVVTENDRSEVVEALSATLSPLQWEYHRRSRGLSMTRARAVMKRTLTSILRDIGVDA